MGSEKIYREIDVSEISIRDLFRKLGLTSSEYVVLKNNIVVTEDDIARDNDEITIIPVKSGGS
uniref:Thiamine biosynthesis protein ThiS n=1 Tax=Staphylothermus marinus TaxID=2280 RepID=A0A7C4D9B1_STAMA